MRALQIDPINGNPQKWAQNCFFMCAYAVLVQLLAIPIVLDGKLKAGATEGDVTFELSNPTVYMGLQAVRYTAMQCVMNLTIQFFFVYLMLWVSITVKQFADLG